jgi:hypothetical protein
MITGFVGEYSTMARYASFDIAIMSDGKCGIVKHCRCISRSSGRALQENKETNLDLANHNRIIDNTPQREVEDGMRRCAYPPAQVP